jgi:hypothetical protein
MEKTEIKIMLRASLVVAAIIALLELMWYPIAGNVPIITEFGLFDQKVALPFGLPGISRWGISRWWDIPIAAFWTASISYFLMECDEETSIVSSIAGLLFGSLLCLFTLPLMSFIIGAVIAFMFFIHGECIDIKELKNIGIKEKLKIAADIIMIGFAASPAFILIGIFYGFAISILFSLHLWIGIGVGLFSAIACMRIFNLKIWKTLRKWIAAKNKAVPEK